MVSFQNVRNPEYWIAIRHGETIGTVSDVIVNDVITNDVIIRVEVDHIPICMHMMLVSVIVGFDTLGL